MPDPKAIILRWCTQIFIITFLGLILIDGMPSTSSWHRRLKGPVDRVVDHLGIWQGPWNLFAPGVDKVNTRLEANIIFDDGSRRIWRSPNWSEMGPYKKFITFRQAEYFDSIRLDWNKGGWEPLAIFLAGEFQQPETKVASVELVRFWTEIAGPEETSYHEHQSSFYKKTFQ